MNKLQSIWRYFVVSLIIIIAIIWIVDIRKSKKESQIEKNRYFDSGFSGLLIGKSLNRGIKIQIETNEKVIETYFYGSKNFDYNPPSLYDFIRKGDSIAKIPKSFDLFIYRGNRKYYFQLGEYINGKY